MEKKEKLDHDKCGQECWWAVAVLRADYRMIRIDLLGKVRSELSLERGESQADIWERTLQAGETSRANWKSH